MKHKIILLFTGALFFTLTAKAQQWSIAAYGGYGLLTPGTESYTNYTNLTGSFNKYKYGFGSGPHEGAGVRLKLNETISVGLDADFLSGSKSFSTDLNNTIDTTIGVMKVKYSVFSLVPNVSFKLFSSPAYDIYNTMGIISTVHTSVNFSGHSTSSPGSADPSPSTSTSQFRYGAQFGFQDAFGVDLPVAKRIKLFAQLTGYYLPVSPQSEADVGISGGVTIIENTKFIGGNNHNYILSVQQNGNNATFNAEDNTITQHIFSIGINAGIVIAIEK